MSDGPALNSPVLAIQGVSTPFAALASLPRISAQLAGSSTRSVMIRETSLAISLVVPACATKPSLRDTIRT